MTSSAGPGLLVRGGRLPVWPRHRRGGAGRIAGGDRDTLHIEAGSRLDVRVGAGVVSEVAEELEPHDGEEVLDVGGAVVLPGLHDHHVHLRAMVAAGRSALVGPADVGGARGLAHALQSAPVDGSGWRRAVGYHESVAGVLDRAALDAVGPGGPLRVQHRSGVLWIVNSAGADALGLDDRDLPGVERDGDGRVTGRLFRLDAWLAERLAGEDPAAALGDISRALAAHGVTGVTDATPGASAESVGALTLAVEEGRLLQRLHVMCPPDVSLGVHPLVSRGPCKVMLDDDQLPTLDELVGQVRVTHGAGAPVAVHCVTATQLALTVAAFESARSAPGDRIEHGSVVDPAFRSALVRLGITVVTNPGFVYARGDDYLEDVDERDVPHLYPCASLLAAGVEVAGGTDAPFGPADPWTAVRAAARRRTRRGRSLGATETIPLARAVGLFTGAASAPARARRVAVGEPGDLCLLAEGPLPREGQGAVLATVVAGRVVHRSG